MSICELIIFPEDQTSQILYELWDVIVLSTLLEIYDCTNCVKMDAILRGHFKD